MRTFLFLTLCFICIVVNGQDTIYKRNGDIVPAKILEVNLNDISYKRSDLLEGPLFIINKNDIKKIRYATGSIDSFALVKPSQVKPIVVRSPIYVPIAPMNPNKIIPTYRTGLYEFQGHRISDRNVMFMVVEKNGSWKNAEIDLHIKEYRRNKIIQYNVGIIGAFVGGVGLFGSAIGAGDGNTHDATIAGFTAILSSGVLISSQVVSYQYKLKRIKNTNKVAELYNRLSGNE